MAVDVLIVGAGLSGLMAAQSLSERGYSVQLVERGRSVGGRLATRRVGQDGAADHGAQFFTVRSETFQGFVDQWLQQDLVYVWGTGWSDGSVKRTFGDGHPRYVVRGGMNRLAKYLAHDHDIALNRMVTKIQLQENSWSLVDSDGERYSGRSLLLTPPMPETLELLSSSEVPLGAGDYNELQRIRFGPCLCGIHEIAGEMALPAPGALQNFQSEIYWVADNHAKGISDRTVVTSHANAKFSRQNWDASEADIVRELEAAVLPYLKGGARIASTQLKKWRYSVPLTTYPEEFLMARGLPRLAFAGDAFGGRGRVEGAFLSGIAAGNALSDALSNA
ncbi:MAG: FAD-dependent oxidoreductase [Chloroflexi bacterium]|nr:FAD-dependent oxidoreductase [Chloroflexota bacterium]